MCCLTSFFGVRRQGGRPESSVASALHMTKKNAAALLLLWLVVTPGCDLFRVWRAPMRGISRFRYFAPLGVYSREVSLNLFAPLRFQGAPCGAPRCAGSFYSERLSASVSARVEPMREGEIPGVIFEVFAWGVISPTS